jgi:two-component system, NarL family, sensor histidine kinase UhpB
MKIASQPDPMPSPSFQEQYKFLLREYVAGGGESALGRAYELGRTAITDQKSLVGIAPLHHQVLTELLAHSKSEQIREVLLQASGDFLAECLSPYEIAHRGFQDAVKALRQLNETLEEQIKLIAYAVHDEAGQLLVAVHLALAEMAGQLPEKQQAKIGYIEELLGEVEQHLRRYSHELRPTILDDLGWVAAIRFLADGVSRRTSLTIHVDADVSMRLATTMETAIYRIAQEALNNIVKHARASNVWIRVWREGKKVLCFSVRDDGAGFNNRNLQLLAGRPGLGLVAMRERASAVGGTLHIESAPGEGTILSLRFPVEDRHANSRRARR